MLVITGIFENERFIPDAPVSIPQKKKVLVTIEEHEEVKSGQTTMERLINFKKKFNRETFIDQLKKQVIEGNSFDFDVQKVVDGNETDEDMQTRYRLEKQAWGNGVKENKQGQ